MNKLTPPHHSRYDQVFLALNWFLPDQRLGCAAVFKISLGVSFSDSDWIDWIDLRAALSSLWTGVFNVDPQQRRRFHRFRRSLLPAAGQRIFGCSTCGGIRGTSERIDSVRGRPRLSSGKIALRDRGKETAPKLSGKFSENRGKTIHELSKRLQTNPAVSHYQAAIKIFLSRSKFNQLTWIMRLIKPTRHR